MTFIYEEDKSLILNAPRIYVSYSGGADSTYALLRIKEYLDSIKLTSKLIAFTGGFEILMIEISPS